MSAPAALLRALFADVVAACDGARLVADAIAPRTTPVAALALGKAAGPMLAGLRARVPVREALVIAPSPDEIEPGDHTRVIIAEHPTPGPASVAAAQAACAFLSGQRAGAPLAVLLSGGGSALACLPAPGLSLADKVAATQAVGRAGATIAELNTLRKHLSAIKGGRLALLACGPIEVLALSDVVGDDPATIASGPFSPDPTTFAEALAILDRLAPGAAPAARAHLAHGAAGGHDETPKPGLARWRQVDHRVLAGPAFVRQAALAAAAAHGLTCAVRHADSEAPVQELAPSYAAGAGATLVIGNGEPRIALGPRPGRGGRATHLALLVARAIAGQTGAAFLAAGTDGQDGGAGAAGAVVDGTTWAAAEARGLDPGDALARHDSATVLDALGALVHARTRSNLLDLHLRLG